ncbi:MAG: YebC/PmpR family DNA-binding transcriptional regulator [Elusimicrobiales bacterium]
MGGHSHWAGIKHKKALADAKKGKVYTKIIREITIAAKCGGGDIDGNPRLRKAVDDARNVNMPQDNVKRAIMKGTGQLPGAMYEELTYEGYGPAKTAIMVDVTTDNKNRTLAEIRKIFEESGGTLGTSGCVAYMFSHKGFISVPKTSINEDELMSAALDAGAEDVKNPDGNCYEIYTAPADYEKVKTALEAKKLPLETSELSMIASTEVEIKDKRHAELIVKLMDSLEEHDDVKNVYSNFDIPDDLLSKIES